MFGYALETSRNGVVWSPVAIFTGKLPLTRAEQALDALDPKLYGRVSRVETGEIKVISYPCSFDLDDVVRDIRS